MKTPINRRTVLGALAAGLLLSACTEEKLSPRESYKLLMMAASGFSQHLDASGSPIFVLFDPQCPHCGALWDATEPLQTLNFVWVPVAVLNGSRPLAAAIAESQDPATLFSAIKHGNLRIKAPAADALTKVDDNTNLLRKCDASGVPYLIAEKTDEIIVTLQGERKTDEIAKLFAVGGQSCEPFF